jgi:hypothetical protein
MHGAHDRGVRERRQQGQNGAGHAVAPAGEALEHPAQMYLSEGTVKSHISRILSRLGLRDRTQAAIYARDHGLI